MKDSALLAFALIVVGSLLAGAWIVAQADGWRVVWAVWPLMVGAFALTGLGNRAVPVPRTPARVLRDEDDL